MDIGEKWELAQAAYAGKVRTFARNSHDSIPGYDQDDVEQELLIVLWECTVAYDPNKGASFNTYFQQSAKNRVISLIRHASTKSRSAVVVSLGIEAVAAAVDECLAITSAEDLALMRITIREYVNEFGEEILNGPGRGRRRAAA